MPQLPTETLLPLKSILSSEDSEHLRIRWMKRTDVDEVLSLGMEGYPEKIQEEELYASLRRRNRISLVAEIDDKIVGFMIYEQTKSRLKLLHLNILPSLRNQTVSQNLLERMALKRRNCPRLTITSLVHERELTKQVFLKSLGFRAVSIQKNYFKSTGDDGYLMQHFM